MVMIVRIALCVFSGVLSASDVGYYEPPVYQVRGAYINQHGQRYSSSFNVSGMTLFVQNHMGSDVLRMIMPLSHFLANQALTGVRLRPEHPKISFNAGFGICDVNHEQCDLVYFSDPDMVNIFSLIFPAIFQCYAKQVTEHKGWQSLSKMPVTIDILQSPIKWMIALNQSFEQATQKGCDVPTLFFIDPRGFVLQGVPASAKDMATLALHEGNNLFCMKLFYAREDMRKTYTWSCEKERGCLLEMATEQRCAKDRLKKDRLKSIVNTCPSDDHHVSVLYLPSESCCPYAASYNIQGITCQVYYRLDGEACTLIQPLWDCLRDQFLLGYRTEVNKALKMPEIDKAQFCLGNANLAQCTQSQFYSELLRYFCNKVFPEISANKKECVAAHPGCSLLLGEMLRDALPKKASIQWSIVNQENMHVNARQAEIYIVVGDVGVLRGVVGVDEEDCGQWIEDSILSESLLEYKLLSARKDLMQTYPWSKEKARLCL